MNKIIPILLLVCSSALASVFPLSLPTTTNDCNYYVSTSGGAGSAGTLSDPIDISTALGGAWAKHTASNVYWLRSGTYSSGTFNAGVTGYSETQPLTLRGYPGEVASISNAVFLRKNVRLQDLTIYQPTTNHVTTESGSFPTNILSDFAVTYSTSPGASIINCVLRDCTRGGVYLENATTNAVIYGNIAYYNGWEGSDRGHGHGFYLQRTSASRVVCSANVMAYGYEHGAQLYGSSPGITFFNSFLTNNMFFNPSSGAPTKNTGTLITAGSDDNPTNVVFESNLFVELSKTNGTYVDFGVGYNRIEGLRYVNNYSVSALSLCDIHGGTITNNTVLSGYQFSPWIQDLQGSPSGLFTQTSDYNTIRGINANTLPYRITVDHSSGTNYSMADWRTLTGQDANSTWVNTTWPPTTTTVVKYVPNDMMDTYSRIAGWVGCVNWNNDATISFTPTNLPACNYSIRWAFNPTVEVASGAYSGSGTITLNPDLGTNALRIAYAGDGYQPARPVYDAGAWVIYASNGGDVTPPVISAVTVSPASTTAGVAWTTDENATSGLEWGATAAYGNSTTNSTLSLSHNRTATSLSPSTTYHYKVWSSDSSGNTTNTADATFTTTPAQTTTVKFEGSATFNGSATFK